MNDADDKVKIQGADGKEQLQTPLANVPADKPVSAVAVDTAQKIVNESPRSHEDNDDSKEKEGISSKEKLEMSTTMQLLGEPLVTHGSYTFYSGLAYRKRGEVTHKKRRRWKKRQSGATIGNDDNSAAASTESSDSSSSSCCCDGDDAGNDLCSCDGSSSSSLSKWSVIHMNHFYAVRPWYSKRNNSNNDQQQLRQQQRRRRENQSPKSSTSAATATERQQHHHQQSVCIGELELLWRDDSIVTATSTLKKPSDNKGMSEPSSTVVSSSNGGGDRMNAMTNSSNNNAGAVASSGDDDGVRNDKNPAALLPRRMLPRRTRQPSAKKLEAAESYAAAAAAAAPDHPIQQQSYRRNKLSTTPTSIPASISVPQTSTDTQYRHGNVLCSVRLYVMPDQTAAGRLSGVHGEDEVLEINTWGANGGVDSNVFINGGSGIGSIYNGGGGVDDYGYGSGSHSSGKLPSGCSGLVLRAEDFVEWVRGGLMNDDEENEDTDFDDKSSESEYNGDSCSNDKRLVKTEVPKPEDEQQSLSKVVKSEDKQCDYDNIETQSDNKVSKVKLESTVTVDVKKNEELVDLKPDALKKEKESLLGISLDQDKVKQEQEEPTADFDLDDNVANMIKDKPNYDDKNHFMKSAVDEAVKAECVPLAAAKIDERYKQQAVHCRRHRCHRQHRRLNNKLLVNGNETPTISKSTVNKVDNKRESGQMCYCYCCKRRRQCNNKKAKAYKSSDSINKQRLVVMSYSRYCRYRAQLQRKQEEQLNEENSKVAISDKEQTVMATNRGEDNMISTRVLFCRDTYDYPAELLLEPFNMQQSQQQNTTVLVNHMAPKLKGWPSYPASWMSFRWNRVRRQQRHLERGNGSNDDQRRRRRRRKLKKKCHQAQNGASGTTGIMNYSSSTDDDDSDSDDGSSASNDTNSTSTSSTSDSDGVRSSSMVAVKIANKNYSASTLKENGGVHQNKKTFSETSANNLIIFNGSNVSANTISKRSAVAVVNPGQQQSTKRRRVVYNTGSQPQFQQQRVIYQQQQQHLRHKQPQQLQLSNQRFKQSELLSQFSQSRHQQMMVAHQHQQRLQSFNKRFPTPISSLQSSTTRVIHHHLPPSVTIMPVIVPSSNVATNQQQHRFNNRLQNKQKQHTVSAVSQRRNSDQQQMSNPAVIEYNNEKKHEYVSDDNMRYKKSTMVAAIAACHRRIERQDFEDDQIQQREDEERQRKWLVDALRLGGLEVTAVPLKSSTNSRNDGGVDSKDTSAVVKMDNLQQQHQRQQSWRQRATSLESLKPAKTDFYNDDIVQNEQPHSGDDHDDDSNPESDSDSIIMTVTPDVVSILNKTQQHRPHQQQLSPKNVSNSTTSPMIGHHQRSIPNINSNISSSKQQKPVSTTAVAAAVLHDKINRAIDSLKQQQQQQKSNTTNNRNNNELVIGGTNHHQSNNDTNNKQQQQRRHKTSSMVGVQHQQNLTPPLLDLSVKSLAAPKSNTIRQQLQKKSLSPFLPTSTMRSSSATPNLEISILPVPTSTTNNIILPQQKHISSIVHNNLTSGSKSVAGSSSVTVRQQLQRRNVTAASTTISSASILDVQGINQNQRRNERVMSETEKTSSQEQKVIILATPKTTVSQPQQQDNKHNPQQNRKD